VCLATFLTFTYLLAGGTRRRCPGLDACQLSACEGQVLSTVCTGVGPRDPELAPSYTLSNHLPEGGSHIVTNNMQTFRNSTQTIPAARLSTLGGRLTDVYAVECIMTSGCGARRGPAER
jgi:hypothetical protein